MAITGFTHFYGSGHYSQSENTLRRYLTEAVRHTSLGGGTEVYGKTRTRALMETLHTAGWGVHSGVHGDADQLFHCWDKRVWEEVAREESLLSKRTYVRVGGATAPPNAAITTVLRNKNTGKTLLRILFHLPAGIEGSSGPGHIYKSYGRALVHLSDVMGAHAYKRAMVKKYRPDAVMLGGDWNLNFARLAVRAFIKTIFPLGVVNDTTFKDLGTLGKRFIDMFLLWHLVAKNDPLVRHSVASDHRWYTQVLAFN